MQKQLKRKGEFKRKKYKQDYLQKINKSKRGLKVSVTFNKIYIKRFKLKKFKKRSIFLKKALKYFLSGRRLKYNRFLKNKNKKYLALKLKISPNNIFCNLSENRSGNNKPNLIKSLSTGAIKLKTTKKRLNFNLKPFLSSFLKPIIREKSVKFSNSVYVRIITPQKFRPKVLEMMRGGALKRLVLKKNVILELPDKKVFNGCRPKKDVRLKNRISLYEK